MAIGKGSLTVATGDFMVRTGFRHRLEAAAAVAGCAVLAPLALAGPAGAAVHAASSTSPGSEFGFTASAYSTYVITGGKAVSTPSAATGFGCATTPRTVSNSGTGETIGADSTSTGTLTNEASLTNIGATSTGSATSNAESVDILGGLIKAADVTEKARLVSSGGSNQQVEA
ncbi:MAG: choice-of-anchor P family protein [Streptosporangiaceae bacterium]